MADLDPGAETDYDLYWGDFHKHMTGPGAPLDRIDSTLRAAREHLDICSVYCYPFTHYRQGDGEGMLMESTGGRPEFEDWWATVNEQSAKHYEAGDFVTFPAYEWHGDRRRWGDHHVVYFEEGYPLDDEPDVRDLAGNLADRRAVLVPHHTAYRVGERGKDWSAFDPDCSPVMEVYSTHGASEGLDTPVPMAFNESMGPRTSGGTLRDALAVGHRVGVVASNDGPGVPGAWDRGLAGVWATALTREAVWEALAERRTYGVTGDRMALWWTLGDAPMGATVDARGPLEASVAVDCPRPLDRIDLVHDGRVRETYTHAGRWEPSDGTGGRHRVLVEFGWGPTTDYGAFEDTDVSWRGTATVAGGDLLDAYPRFVGPGQSYEVVDGQCRFSLLTSRDRADRELPEAVSRATRQGLVFEFEAAPGATLDIDLENREPLSVPVVDAVDRGFLFAFTDEAAELIEDAFGVAEADIGNLDRRYHVAPKVNVHRACPRSACAASVTFDGLPAEDGGYYYVRAAQTDRQYAWGSPVWVEA